MLGKRDPQRPLFGVGNVFPFQLRQGSFHAQLAAAAPRLFKDEDFLQLYCKDFGRPSVAPSQLVLLTLLQYEAGCSDAEAIERSACDLRWAAVLDKAAGEPLCAKSTLQMFRGQLTLHKRLQAVLQASINEAKRAGLLKGGALTIALDTKPIVGRGAVEDTYNLLCTGIVELVRALSRRTRQKPADWAREQGLWRYFSGSLKGSANIDWSNEAARLAFLNEVVCDARRLLSLSEPYEQDKEGEPIREAASLLRQLLLQDIECKEQEDGSVEAKIKEGTAKDRMPSATDPDQRHGRKSKSKRFNGHKGSLAVDTDSQIILDVDVLPGNAPDAQGALEQTERVEEITGQTVAVTLGDCAYGSAETRQEFADEDRTLIAKVPQEAARADGHFSKSAFEIDVEAGEVVCPAGHAAELVSTDKDGGKVYGFGALCADCALRSACTSAKQGRTIHLHAQEAILQAARAYQASEEGKAELRDRVVAEHRLARMGQLGMGQARYKGRKKTRFQMFMLATIANLRWTWNWEEGKKAAEAEAVARDGGLVEGTRGARGGVLGVERGRWWARRTGWRVWRAIWGHWAPEATWV